MQFTELTVEQDNQIVITGGPNFTKLSHAIGEWYHANTFISSSQQFRTFMANMCTYKLLAATKGH